MGRIEMDEKQIVELHKEDRQAKATTKRKPEELYEEKEDPDNTSYASVHY